MNRRVLTLLMLGTLGAALRAAVPGVAAEQAPVLLGIVVEGLDEDYLNLLADNFGRGGFRRLTAGALAIPQADYGTASDATAAAALLMTGAEPAVNGIPATYVYDRQAMRPRHIFADGATLGNFTGTGYSAAPLRTSTLSDEARIAGGGVSVAYAVAPTAAEAMVLGGHAANSAVWLDTRTGNWASTTYYREMPASVASRNRLSPLEARLDTMSWAPLRPLNMLPVLPEHLRLYPFRYVFPRNGKTDRYDLFAASPMLNNEVTSVAIDIIDNLRIGQHPGGTDVLNVKYTLLPYPYGKNHDNRAELMDAYLRLDANIGQLLAHLDRATGGTPGVVLLAGTPAPPTARRDDPQWKIPSGEFSTRKAVSLLNMYLIALHGNGNYVQGYHNGAFYLNHNTLKEHSLDEGTVRRQSAEFLRRMTGVARAYALDDILAGTSGDDTHALRRSIDTATAADVYIAVSPGFELLDDHSTVPSADRIPTATRASTTTAPVYITGPGIEPRVIGHPVDVRAVAPTVSRALRIRAPNGAAQPGL